MSCKYLLHKSFVTTDDCIIVLVKSAVFGGNVSSTLLYIVKRMFKLFVKSCIAVFAMKIEMRMRRILPGVLELPTAANQFP